MRYIRKSEKWFDTAPKRSYPKVDRVTTTNGSKKKNLNSRFQRKADAIQRLRDEYNRVERQRSISQTV